MRKLEPSALHRDDASGAVAAAYGIIAHHSKSFSLASRVLPPEVRAEAAIVYSWCRRVDDAVDLAPTPAHALRALDDERKHLEEIYGPGRPPDPLLAAFQEVVRRRHIPKQMPLELLEGMQMDLEGETYSTLDELKRYCFRVAGTVGVMMSHVMGVTHPHALRQATHLGMAMQLTNICRDVLEDWQLGRLYLPTSLLERQGLGELRSELGAPLRPELAFAIAPVVQRMLGLASDYYRSGDEGLRALSWRCAWAVGSAREVYSEIGQVIARQRYDVFAGRAVVSRGRKLFLVARALLRSLAGVPRRLFKPFARCELPEKVVVDELMGL